MTDFIFDGFEPANTTPVPDVLFDELLAVLNESELKVLLYIIRRTAGFKKPIDAISLTQFQKGIKKRATGEILDRGCGVKDRSTIIKALTSLEAKGYIQSTKSNDPQGDKATSAYRIRFRSGVVGKTNHPTDMGSGQNQPPWWAKPTTGSGQNQPGVVGDSDPQETVIQSNSLQETVKQGSTYDSATATSSPALIAHPEHNFIWFDDLMKPSLMVVRYTPAFPSRFFSEYEDKRRSRRADEIRCVFEERGINMRVRYEHEAGDETTVEAEEYIPQFNYLQDIRKTEQQASGMIVVVDSELAARSEEAQHDSYSPAPSLGYEKEKETYGDMGMAARGHHYGSAVSAARAANTGRGTGGKGRGTGKSKAVGKVYFSLEGAAFRQWWEELTGATVDETAANAAACNKVGKKASATYENTKLVVDEIRANKWVKTNRVAVTPQDLANDTSNLRWEKWLQPAQQSRAQKPPTREEDPYSVAALLEEQNPGYHARKEAMSRGDYSFADILSANS